MKKLLLLSIILILISINIGCKKINNQYLVIAYNGLNLRESPSSNAKSITLINQGTVLNVLEKSSNIDTINGLKNNWYKTTFMNKTGWIYGGYIINYNENECRKVINSLVAYHSKEKIFLKNGLYSKPEIVAEITRCQEPSFSHDGSKIIFTQYDYDNSIFIYNISTKKTNKYPTRVSSQLRRAYYTPNDKYIMTDSGTGSYSGYEFYDPNTFQKVYESGTFYNFYWLNDNEILTYLPEKGTRRPSEEMFEGSSLCVVNIKSKKIQYINRATNLSEPSLKILLPNYVIFSELKVSKYEDWYTDKAGVEKIYVCSLKNLSQINEISNFKDKQFIKEKNEFAIKTEKLRNVENYLIAKLFNNSPKFHLSFKSIPNTSDIWYFFIADNGLPTGDLYLININNINSVHIVAKDVSGIFDYDTYNK